MLNEFSSAVAEIFRKVCKNFESSIEYNNVTFAYRTGDNIINGISFKVNRGEVLALVGPSGSGTELFKQFMDNEGFKRWMTDTVFGLTYDQPAVEA